jgi:hypothetical protein
MTYDQDIAAALHAALPPKFHSDIPGQSLRHYLDWHTDPDIKNGSHSTGKLQYAMV